MSASRSGAFDALRESLQPLFELLVALKIGDPLSDLVLQAEAAAQAAAPTTGQRPCRSDRAEPSLVISDHLEILKEAVRIVSLKFRTALVHHPLPSAVDDVAKKANRLARTVGRLILASTDNTNSYHRVFHTDYDSWLIRLEELEAYGTKPPGALEQPEGEGASAGHNRGGAGQGEGGRVRQAKRPPGPSTIAEDSPRVVLRRARINARMLETIQGNPESLGWNSRQWAEHLKCAKSSVVETTTWKDLSTRRERERAERARDRRRRPQGK